MKTKKTSVLVVLAGTFLSTALATAQTTSQRLVAVLMSSRMPAKLENERFSEIPRRLAELGWVENKNIRFEWRWADGNYDRLPALAAELVRLGPDVLLCDGTPGIRAVQGATRTIPIVFLGGTDPVASGFVKSMAHPGGNMTGVSMLLADSAGKQLEILKGILPRLVRLAVIVNPANPAHAGLLKEFQQAANAVHVSLQPLEARTPEEIERQVLFAARSRTDALLWAVDSFLIQQQGQIAELTARYRLPSMAGTLEYPAVGGLMGYGPDRWKLWRRAADYVDKVLRGANPGDLPVDQPTKLELVINKKTAVALRLAIPPELLVQAARVIE